MAAKRKYGGLGRHTPRKKARRRAARPKAAKKNPGVKMRKAPKGWIKAKAVRVVRRGGRRIVEVRR